MLLVPPVSSAVTSARVQVPAYGEQGNREVRRRDRALSRRVPRRGRLRRGAPSTLRQRHAPMPRWPRPSGRSPTNAIPPCGPRISVRPATARRTAQPRRWHRSRRYASRWTSRCGPRSATTRRASTASRPAKPRANRRLRRVREHSRPPRARCLQRCERKARRDPAIKCDAVGICDAKTEACVTAAATKYEALCALRRAARVPVIPGVQCVSAHSVARVRPPSSPSRRPSSATRPEPRRLSVLPQARGGIDPLHGDRPIAAPPIGAPHGSPGSTAAIPCRSATTTTRRRWSSVVRGSLDERVARPAEVLREVLELRQPIADLENLLAVVHVERRLECEAGDRAGGDVPSCRWRGGG